jgi:hypothetical protein
MSEKQSYKESLNDAVEELQDTLAERANVEEQLDGLNRRIDSLQEAIRGLSPLCGLDYRQAFPDLYLDNVTGGVGNEIGLTDAIRLVLRSQPHYSRSATDVRDALKYVPFKTDKYTNVLASIHTVLKRLHKNEEVKTEEKDGKTCYKWANKPES